jgi:2'-5' RNA ligase
MRQRHRLFIAVDPTPEVQKRAGRVAATLRAAGLEAAWVDPPQLHVTLHFLGDDVDDADLHRLCVAVDRAAAEVPPFRMGIGGVGVFPDLRRPRVVWLGVRDGADDLVRLHDALAGQLTPLGFPPEARGFRPHLTLGRFRGGQGRGGADDPTAAALAACGDADAGETSVSRVVLYASRLAKTGAEHDRLHVGRLGG